MILPFSFHPRMASFHLNCIGRILLLQQYQSEDRKGHREVVSVELTHLSFVCIQKIGFGIRLTARNLYYGSDGSVISSTVTPTLYVTSLMTRIFLYPYSRSSSLIVFFNSSKSSVEYSISSDKEPSV